MVVMTDNFLFQVSVYLQNWSHVQSYVNKAEGTPEVTEVSIHLSCRELPAVLVKVASFHGTSVSLSHSCK